MEGLISEIYGIGRRQIDLTRSCPALQIGIPQDTENGCDVIVVLFFRLTPNLDSGLSQ